MGPSFPWWQAVPWVLALASLWYTATRNSTADKKAEIERRRAHDEAVNKRLLDLEVGQKVGDTRLDAELRIIRHQVGQANGSMGQIKDLFKQLRNND